MGDRNSGANGASSRAHQARRSSVVLPNRLFVPGGPFAWFLPSHSSKPATAENSMRNSTATVQQCGNQVGWLRQSQCRSWPHPGASCARQDGDGRILKFMTWANLHGVGQAEQAERLIRCTCLAAALLACTQTAEDMKPAQKIGPEISDGLRRSMAGCLIWSAVSLPDLRPVWRRSARTSIALSGYAGSSLANWLGFKLCSAGFAFSRSGNLGLLERFRRA